MSRQTFRQHANFTTEVIILCLKKERTFTSGGTVVGKAGISAAMMLLEKQSTDTFTAKPAAMSRTPLPYETPQRATRFFLSFLVINNLLSFSISFVHKVMVKNHMHAFT